MNRIIQLDESLANLIAAGEVVENMASVIKELVENSLDASAQSIDIHLQNYGLGTIRVADDGHGIATEDIPIAFKRHATSKIKTQHDLFHIMSLGFRGEALPSIAGVSEVSIESVQEGSQARKIVLKTGRIVADSIASIKKGTIVTVKNLFYNTPARLKHLKSEQRELSFIVDLIHKMALAHPNVRFLLTHEDKTLLHTAGDGDIKKILYQIYNASIAKEMLEFEGSHAYFEIKGFLSKPAIMRSNRQHINLVTNHRIIRNNQLYKAVIEGYKSYLPIQKYPIVYLEIHVDPLLIDVNIHPQKWEVKFVEEILLAQLITETIRKRLRAENVMHRVVSEPIETLTYPQLDLERSRQATNNLIEENGVNETLSQEPSRDKKIPNLEYIGQLHGTYLLFQNEKGLYLVDQHAAEERIRYEKYLTALSTKPTGTRPLLVSLSLPFSQAEIGALSSIIEAMQTMGLIIEEVEEQTVKIREVPTWFLEGHEEATAESIFLHLIKGRTFDQRTFIDQLAINLACKQSIKANRYLSKEEVWHLMDRLERTDQPYHCPHGRPTIIEMSQYELEKMFQRIQT